MKRKNILDLSAVDAKKMLLTHEAYSNIDLPPYFSFGSMLSGINKALGSNELAEKELNKAKKTEKVNHLMYGNKDGKYAWRKFELIHPLLYVSMVNILTNNENWVFLQNRFKEFQGNKNIECESLPVLPTKGQKQKASQITQWVSNIEKRSIALSLEYRFLYQTDITDCYGSIYTHSLSWAVHTRDVAKAKRGFASLFGNQLDCHLQAMSHGQTNGIPQGSMLTDLLAEIILGYADEQLTKKLEGLTSLKKYHVLRYRDDYRIFVDSVGDGEVILKCLSEVLLNLGFRLNTGKTSFSTNVIGASLKPDKYDNLRFEPVPEKLSKRELLRQLLIAQKIGIAFPNAGTLLARISKILDVVKVKDFKTQEHVIASVLVDIGYLNPNSFPMIASLATICVSGLATSEKKKLLLGIQNKICTLPNIGLIELWMQRMSLGIKFKLEFNENLCKLVDGRKQAIFESGWVTDTKIKKLVDANLFVSKTTVGKVKWKIPPEDVQLFEY